MKNSILTTFAIAALASCEKKDTQTFNHDGIDSTSTASNALPVNDSANVSGSTESTVTLNDQDKKFADAAAIGGMMEVMMGNLAASKGTDGSVKELGTMMTKDHGMANDELKKWAASAGYMLPASLDAEKQKMYDDLKAKKGAEFDKMYAELMVSDHKKDIASFKDETSKGQEPGLKTFASKTIPILDHHLMESEKVKAGIK